MAFDPAKYEYLRKLRLEGYIWEFVRRNDKYTRLLTKLGLGLRKSEIRIKEVQSSQYTAHQTEFEFSSEEVASVYGEIKNQFGIEFRVLDIDDPHQGYILVKPESEQEKYKSTRLGIPNPKSTYDDFEIKPIIKGAEPVVTYKLKDKAIQSFRKGKEESFQRYCLNTIERLAPKDLKETLYIGISLSGKREDIMERLEKIVYTEVHSQRERTRTAKRAQLKSWFNYLVAYDLFKEHEKERDPYVKITNELRASYPDKTFNSKTVFDWVSKAEGLIAKGYDDYID